jgi:hypothetical protein
LRIENERYLREHPEISLLVQDFLKQSFLEKPDDVREYAACKLISYLKFTHFTILFYGFIYLKISFTNRLLHKSSIKREFDQAFERELKPTRGQ